MSLDNTPVFFIAFTFCSYKEEAKEEINIRGKAWNDEQEEPSIVTRVTLSVSSALQC